MLHHNATTSRALRASSKESAPLKWLAPMTGLVCIHAVVEAAVTF
jgi:hypothetical protein